MPHRALAPLLLALTAVSARADLPAVEARGTLRVLVSADENPAWFAMQAIAAPGFEREVLEGFARLRRLKLEVVPVARWEAAIPDLLAGRGDVVVGMNDTPARREQIAFTGELIPSRHVVVTRRPGRVVRSVEEFREERVGVVTGASWEPAVAAAGVPEARRRSFPDGTACLDALRSGKISATPMALADFLLQRRADPELQAGLALGPAVPAAWGVRKSDPLLRAEMDSYLQNLKRSATWSRLVVQYFGEDALRLLGREREE